MDREPKPKLKWDELRESTAFREKLRYRKGRKTRIYNLRDVADGTELWVVTEEPGKEAKSRNMLRFENSDDIGPFLEDVERELRTGGWTLR